MQTPASSLIRVISSLTQNQSGRPMTAFIWGCPVKTKLFVGTRQAWTRFLVGAVVLSILGVIGAHWFKDNYRIGIDYQQVTSVRNTNVFIVDLHDFELERGG